MRSIALSRSVFGSARISLIHAALLAGTTLIAANARAQLTETSPPSGSQSGGMEHKETPTPLRELVQEAEQKNPQIAAAYHGAQAARNIPKQVSAFPETQVSVQQFSVGSPRPFSGYSNSDFAYIGFGASQDVPFPGKRDLRARAAEHGAESIEAQTDSVRSSVVESLKMVYFRLAYIQQTLDVLESSDQLLKQVQEAAEARYRVGQGNQQDVLKAQLQHTKILQEVAHHHQEEGLLEIHHFETFDDRTADRIGLRFYRFSPVFRRARAQIALARKWNILRRAEADIGELAIAVAGKGPWTSNTELLYRHLGFRKC